MKRYRKYIKPYLGAFILGPLLMLTEVAGEIMLPKLMSMIINNGVAQRNVQYILSVGGLMILATLIMAIGGIGGAYFSVKAAVSFTSDLRDDLFSKVQEFSFKNIDSYSTGSLVTRLTNDIQQIQNVLMMGLRMAMRAPGMFIGALIMAFMMNARLAVVILVVIPLLTAAIAVILKTAFPRFTAMQKKLDQLNSGIQEALTNVRVIKSFVREEFEEEKFRDMNQDLKNSSLDAMKIVIVTMPVMTLAMNITTLAVVWYGGNIIIAGDMPVGDLTAFTTYIVQILMSLMMLSMVFLQLSRAVASIRRVGEVMDTEIDLTDRDASRKDLAVLKGKVEFKHVSFSYTDNRDEMVLEDINFTAEPGQIIGIIGSTGSGKSTLINLIPRFYDVQEGEILVDGVNVKEMSLETLRGKIGLVPQKAFLFRGTIAENVGYGQEEPNQANVEHAVMTAQSYDFVTAKEGGFDAPISQGGANVSGGQRQRLAIARAIARKPEIYIFDDSFSALDYKTDAALTKALLSEAKEATVILVAQRVSTIKNADRILVLEDGRCVGQGRHEELMKSCEVYREIVYSQLTQEEAEKDEV